MFVPLLWVLLALSVPAVIDAYATRGVYSVPRQPRGWGPRECSKGLEAIDGAGVPRRLAGVLQAGESVRDAEPATASATSVDEAREALRQAAETRSAPKEEVSAALEMLAGGSLNPMEVSEVEGEWELIFSTQLKSGYMPVKEIIGFHPARDEIAIDTTIGPLPLGGVRGRCSWIGGASNELAFAISSVKFGPFTFGREPQVKTYSFFFSQGELLAARSSAGSFSLLLRV